MSEECLVCTKLHNVRMLQIVHCSIVHSVWMYPQIKVVASFHIHFTSLLLINPFKLSDVWLNTQCMLETSTELWAGFVILLRQTTVNIKENRKQSLESILIDSLWFQYLLKVSLLFNSPLHRKRKQGTLFSYPSMFYIFCLLQDALKHRHPLTVK